MRLFARKRSSSPSPAAVSQDIVQRVDRLEAMVEALQDALYRESQRQDQEMEDLRDRTRPEHMAKALSDDARRRGL